MGWQSIVLLIVIGILIVFAVISYIRTRKKGGKCGSCAGCTEKGCPYLNKAEKRKNKENKK